MRFRFNKIKIPPFKPKEGHSVLLFCNHFSWWDGFFAGYLTYWHIKRNYYVMMQHDQLDTRKWIRWLGGFSINRSSREAIKSLQYAAQLLSTPENLVTVFPQGALYSTQTKEIVVERGIEILLKNIKGPCQIVYSCVLTDYFESLKPSLFYHLFDCGVVGETSFEELTQKINTFHQQALKDQLEAHL